MGTFAEDCVDKYGFTREQQDEFAFNSQQKAIAAKAGNKFTELVPTPAVRFNKKENGTFQKETFIQDFDDGIRESTTKEGLAKLRPAFKPDGGKVTAGNACGMTDGACAIVLTTREKAKELGATPLFSILGYSNVAVDGKFMGEGPGVAVQLLSGEDRILARITRRSADALGIRPGVECYGIMKVMAVARGNVGLGPA